MEATKSALGMLKFCFNCFAGYVFSTFCKHFWFCEFSSQVTLGI